MTPRLCNSAKRNALHNARKRGQISLAIVSALAEEWGPDPKVWIVVAPLDSQCDSACEDRTIKRVNEILLR